MPARGRILSAKPGRGRTAAVIWRPTMGGDPRRLLSYLFRAAAVAAVFLALSVGRPGVAQQQPAGEWPNITGGYSSTRYSTLDQINAANFNTLRVAWEWRGAKDAGVNLGG